MIKCLLNLPLPPQIEIDVTREILTKKIYAEEMQVKRKAS
jgi:hypothetical protein